MYNFSRPSQEELKRDKDNDRLRILFVKPIVDAALRRNGGGRRTTTGLVHCAKNTCRDLIHKTDKGVICIESTAFDRRKNKHKISRWYYCASCSKKYRGALKNKNT